MNPAARNVANWQSVEHSFQAASAADDIVEEFQMNDPEEVPPLYDLPLPWKLPNDHHFNYILDIVIDKATELLSTHIAISVLY